MKKLFTKSWTTYNAVDILKFMGIGTGIVGGAFGIFAIITKIKSKNKNKN